MNLYETMQDIQENLHKKGVFRCIKAKDQKGAFIYLDKKPYVNLSSNDYLGLAEDELLNEEFLDTLPFDAKRMSSSGSPLLTGAFNSINDVKIYASNFLISMLYFLIQALPQIPAS